jgi:hypothetical protein
MNIEIFKWNCARSFRQALRCRATSLCVWGFITKYRYGKLSLMSGLIGEIVACNTPFSGVVVRGMILGQTVYDPITNRQN